MTEDFKKYLATEILSEQRTISYRHVSRALKVHVNAAKCMLYDFYQFQNDKKPGSIYATYLLSGTKRKPSLGAATNGTGNKHKHDFDIDEHIPSSPPPFTSSMLEPSQQSSQAEEDETPHVAVRTITLVREDALEGTILNPASIYEDTDVLASEMKEQYEVISSIHIYSLSPTRIQDLVTLTDISRGLFTDVFMKEDPLQHNKTYGVIQNPNVRRRKGKRPVVPQGPAPKFQPVKDEPKKTSIFPTKSAAKPSTPASAPKNEDASRPSSRDSTSTTSSAKQPTLKRDASDLFKAFAKQGRRISTPTSAPKSTNKDEDTTMKDAADDDEGESEEDALFLDTNTRKPGTTKKRPSDAKKKKEERAAELRKLVQSDDEAESESAEPKAEKGTDAKPESKDDKDDEDANEEEQVAWSDSDSEKKKKPEPKPEPEPQHEGPKRRRGKRKVMKKRTMKDEDGYLVTKEEAVWESFSEDEPEPAPAAAKKDVPRSSFGKMQTQTHSQSQSQSKAGAKKKGGGGAGGGGNIMSFFGKKNT